MLAREKKFVHGVYVFEVFAFLVALATFLVITVGILNRINDNLLAVQNQAASVDRSATSLPGLVASITGSLQSIEQHVKPVHGQLDQINAGLGTTSAGLGTAESNLSGTDSALAHIETGLIASLGFAHRVRDGSIGATTVLSTASGRADSAIALLTGVKSDTGTIESLATLINGHLASIANELQKLP